MAFQQLKIRLVLRSIQILKNILIIGDFNLDTLKQISNRKIFDLCQHYNLEQLINEPTNFTETSSTIIDLFLTANKDNILLSGVDDPFLDQNVSSNSTIDTKNIFI